MGRLTTDLGGSLGVLLISLGTRSGLWRALDGAGPLTARQVADRVTVDRALVREWLRAQAAAGYLDYDPAADTFELSPAAAAAIPDGPGSPLVEACMEMITAMIAGFDDFSTAFGAGDGFGWHQRSGQHWHGQDAFTRLTVPDELIGAAVDALPDVAASTRRRRNRARRRLRIRRTDAGDRPAAFRGAGAGHRLPRRIGDGAPGRLPPTPRSTTRGSRWRPRSICRTLPAAATT